MKGLIKAGSMAILLYLILFFHLDGFGQSPWLPAKKGYFFQLSYNGIPSYTTLFNQNTEDIQTPRSVVDQTLQFYGEYGLSDRFSLLASIPYKMLRTGDINPDYTKDISNIPDATTVNAPGNIQLSLKYKLFETKWISALQFTTELPADDDKAEETGLYPGYDAFAFTPLASFGRGWSKTYFYAWTSYIIRTNNISDQFDGGIEGGLMALKNFWIILYFNARITTTEGNASPPPPEKQLGLYSNYQEYTAYGLKLLYEFKINSKQKLGFIAHGAGSFSGHLVAKSPLLSLGVYLKR